MMNDAQTGIFAEGSTHHYWLEYDIAKGTSQQRTQAAVRDAIAGALDTNNSAETSMVVAFGGHLWRDLAPGRTPESLRVFTEIEGPSGHRAPATQHALWFWIHGNRHDLNFDRVLAIHEALDNVGTLAIEERGFLYCDSRDLTGFIDGTANPTGDARRDVALVPEGKPGAGGSFVLTQRWIHDLTAFQALTTKDQESVIGRTKPDSVELKGDAMPADSHVSRTDLKRGGVGVKIYRRSAPFGTVLEHGLYFQAFSAELDRFDLMLNSMFGTTGDELHDRLIEFSRPTSGSYFFAPSQRDLIEVFTLTDAA